MNIRKSDKECVLLVTIIFLLAIPSSTSYKYCVGEESSCHSASLKCEQCHSLMWYANNISSNSLIFFLSGNHYLNSSISLNAVLSISSLVNITLQGNQSTVICTGNQSGFVFQNSSEITIERLEFNKCGANYSSTQASILFELSHSLRLSHVKVRNSRGYGLYMNNVYRNVTINNSEFDRSELGNAMFQLKWKILNQNSKLYITSSNFTNGGNLQRNSSAGLTIYMPQPHYTLELTDLILRNNTGEYGGNIAIKFIDFSQCTSSFSIENSTIENGNGINSGGGLFFLSIKKTS